MTLVVTISCPDGIVMGADRLITVRSGANLRSINSRRKIIPLFSHDICISYWGLATLNRIRMERHIRNVEKIVINSGAFNINTFSSALLNYLTAFQPTTPMGFHISGYYNNQPEIRHIFHEAYHPIGGNYFTLENTNLEYHDINNGNRLPHPHRINYFPLFNGDNIMVNGLINYPQLLTRGRMSIQFNRMNLSDARKLVEILMVATINMQNFVGIYQRRGRIVGNGIDIFTIVPNVGISQVAKSRKTIKIDLR